MRILAISAQKPDSTGSGVYLAETARSMANAGHDVMVVAGIDVADDPHLPEGVLFRPVRYNTEALPFNVCGMSDQMPYPSTRYRDMNPEMVQSFSAAFAEAALDACKDFEPDVVICHHLYLLASVVRAALPQARVYGVCHSTDLRQMRSHGLQRERIIAGVKALDGIFALHEEQKAEIVEVYGVDPGIVTITGTGYNATIFHPGIHEIRKPYVFGDEFELVFVGKVCRSKGIFSLIRALDLIDPATLPVSVRLVGGHNSEEEYERIRALAAKSKHEIELTGVLSQENLVFAYQSAHAFVLPSFFEGLPLVLVEALACGCFAVCTDLPGVQPWIRENVPDAPVQFVELPAMQGVDEPCADDLPGFESRLARAIEACAKSREAWDAANPGAQACVTAQLSWRGLSTRILASME